MPYCIYLRKSRADLEAEARGEGETLARHERALKELAVRRGYPIAQIYREIVSGESIANRPQMRQLLSDVAARKYEGVLVMEVERLARGDTADQAAVANTFKYSDTLIVTPVKTYDPNNGMDEEYFEFSLFMSRREYKTIVRRMQTGRRLAAKEGKYIASVAPYGYARIKRPDGAWTLEIIPEQAQIVRSIFDWYAHGEGGARVAARLNAMGLRTPRDNPWTQSTVSRLIKNPVYIGCVTWDKRVDTVVGLQDGVKQHRRLLNRDATCVRGLHEPIVDEALFAAANHTGREGSLPRRTDTPLGNPFAGLVRCTLCGHHMVRCLGALRPDGTRYPSRITCRTPGCANYGCAIATLETLVLETLRKWSVYYAGAPAQQAESPHAAALDQARQHVAQLEGQRTRLCELLERGIYSEELYMQRSVALAAQITAAREALDRLTAEASRPDPDALIRAVAPHCAAAISAYRAAQTAETQNRVLRQVIDHIDYFKPERGNNRDDKSTTILFTVFPFASS